MVMANIYELVCHLLGTFYLGVCRNYGKWLARLHVANIILLFFIQLSPPS
jgi:hypothetical protein